MDMRNSAEAGETVSASPKPRPLRVHAKPCPPDIVSVALSHTTLTLQRHYGVGSSTMRRWLKVSGAKTRPRGGNGRRDAPKDFEVVAPGKTIAQLQIIYRCSDSMISRWRKACGIVTISSVRRPMPDQFREDAAYYSLRELAARYGVARDTITRWAVNAGIRLKGRPVAKTKDAPSIAKAGVPRTPPIPALPAGAAAQAAQHLRRFFPNVYPAAILDLKERKRLPGFGRDMWVVAGRGTLPANDLIALAESKGFDQRAWAAI
ncbi:hypothetical protein PQ455_01575 [Sphingomonas naphthae]|uniref:Transposase n=1 Tax=Sphingomonas naphthae TaxID=1813468 RepID=A0ABY7TLX7_9SPHN|nr:hypothetical protein [Sphingomonas naphthae]WCT73950.1 hypothetical protein PQ455_01575 [Sphingomonas naphthae]